MTKEQLLAMGLTEEQAQSVLDGFGTMVPKSRLDEKIKELKAANDTITERDTQLEELKPKAAGNDALQAEITRLQQENKDNADKHATELAETRLSSAVKLALTGKVQDLDIVSGLLNKEKIELDEQGNVKGGLDDQLMALKESKSFLFVPETESAQPPAPNFGGGNHNPPQGGGDNDPFTAKLAKYE
ncbi:phage scaffolding protein [Metasolibacillus meyeri]|uniref:phage scaffolding protein n=1 Tax=Metasolibacillus meyeri TaxID=1071052 RepID=UPI000D30BB4C|nr:phage scaffolding protein [Metasolibacillus meyeri]